MTMIERVARAIARSSWCPGDGSLPVEDYVDLTWELCLPQAKAAIEAMREPT